MAAPTGSKDMQSLGKAGAPVTTADGKTNYADMVMPVDSTGTPIPAGTAATPVSVTPAVGTYTNKSGAIAAAGVAQTLMAANATRKRIFIQNPGTATGQNIATAESIFINFTTAAGIENGASIEIEPGQSFDSGNGPVTTELISVIATTIAHRYIAKELN